jgi:DNA-binding FadR family transcriptional regulator
MSNEALAEYGVSRKIKALALRQLEAAGLVAIERRPGKAPLVRLLA